MSDPGSLMTRIGGQLTRMHASSIDVCIAISYMARCQSSRDNVAAQSCIGIVHGTRIVLVYIDRVLK